MYGPVTIGQHKVAVEVARASLIELDAVDRFTRYGMNPESVREAYRALWAAMLGEQFCREFAVRLDAALGAV